MDVFNQNWTERMKNDPYTNKVLNLQTPRKLEYTRYRKYLGQDQYVPVSMPFQQRRLNIIKTWPILPYDATKRRRNVYYLVDAKINDMNIDYYDKLYPNSRPNSLYNLHYASLR